MAVGYASPAATVDFCYPGAVLTPRHYSQPNSWAAGDRVRFPRAPTRPVGHVANSRGVWALVLKGEWRRCLPKATG
jgi:hypothetical protein